MNVHVFSSPKAFPEKAGKLQNTVLFILLPVREVNRHYRNCQPYKKFAKMSAGFLAAAPKLSLALSAGAW